jgi:hypothetical protein
MVDFIPGFRAKNDPSDPSGNAPVIPAVEIKSLSSVVDPEDTDRFLCPVRALKCYLKRSRCHRGDKRLLFVSLNKFYEKDISTQTIARWLKATVTLAYQRSGFNPPEHIKAHETRAIASSLAKARGIPLATLLSAAFWRRENTFLSYYLRDLRSERKDGVFTFKHLVLANFVTS